MLQVLSGLSRGAVKNSTTYRIERTAAGRALIKILIIISWWLQELFTASILKIFSWLPWLDDSAFVFGATKFAFLSLFSIIILLIPRHATLLRFMGLVALSALTYILQETFFQLCKNPLWRAAAAPLLWIQFLSASEMILVSQVDPAHISASRGESRPQTIAAQAIHVIGLLWNLRRVGTRWQVKYTPASSSSGPASRSRARFVLRRLTTTMFAYLVLDIMVSGPSPDLVLVSPQKETLFKLSYLSLDDVVFRTIGTVSFWLSTALFNLIMANSVAVFPVFTGLSSPSDCPPIYGSFWEAYSIRRFWGVSWHQCLRKGLNGHADIIADSVFSIPRATAVSRYTRLFLAFLISGLIHHSSDVAMGIPRAEAGSLVFFLLQPLGIMLEDGMQTLTRHVPTSKFLGRAQRIVGYLWVMMFLAWSTPTWFYPHQRQAVDPVNLLPFHVFGPLIHQLQIFWQR